MQGSDDANSSTPPVPANAFDPEFLEALDAIDDPETAAEAEVAGPLSVRRLADGTWAIFLQGESPEEGDLPAAVFLQRERALAAAAIFLPGTGRDPAVRWGPESPRGFPLLDPTGRVIGWLRQFDDPWKDAIHAADGVLRSPESLTRFVRAAGGSVLRRTGRLLRQAGPDDPPV